MRCDSLAFGLMFRGFPDLDEDELQAALKEAMRVYPQGVTVVTTSVPDGPKGITVSSFTSVSLTPPLIMISLAKGSVMYDVLVGSKAFAVNFLADDQKSVSDRFAGRGEPKDRFEGIRFRPGSSGSPVIEGVRAVIECRVWKVYEGGDHSLVIGEVIDARTLGKKRPLVYLTQQYTTTELPEHPAPPSDIVW